jgi:hypothetical protein
VLNEQFDLEVDASGFAVGAVLLQKKEDRKHHPVGYYSATLNKAERNYDIYNLELLAIVKALRNWRPLLAGSPHNIRVFSDHMNLQYWRDPQKISRRVTREFLELQEFPIKIHHVKGRAMDAPMHYCEDQTTTRENTTIPTSQSSPTGSSSDL